MSSRLKVVSLARAKADNDKFMAERLRQYADQLEHGGLDAFDGLGTPEAVLIVGVYRDISGVLLDGLDPSGLLNPLMVRGALVTALDQTYEPPEEVQDSGGDE